MRLPRIKFCGFTREQDVALAIALQVEAIGLNFYPQSKRYIAPQMARGLSSLARGSCLCVGIFVDATFEQIDQVLDECPLDAIQLHGNESLEWLLEYESSPQWPGLPILKALPYRGEQDDPVWREWVQEQSLAYSSVLGLLVDAYEPVEKGGTGKRVDWGLLSPRPGCMLDRNGDGVPLLLAGGLNVDNVIEGLERVGPAGIDIASGIEVSPGIKDPIKMESIVRAVRHYDDSR